jgi:uncharacterized repeat protein (TIGR03803 family)
MKHTITILCLNFFAFIPEVKSQTELWSMSQYGGTANQGAIYKLNPENGNYTGIYNFPHTSLNARAPEYSTPTHGGNGKLYSLTRFGGDFDKGLIFSFDTTTNTFEALHSFGAAAADGVEPYASLLLCSNGKLYGTTKHGGKPSGYGTIFSYDPNTNVYSKLHEFDYINGSGPECDLIEASNGLLYGTTIGGSGGGVLFSFDPATNTFSNLISSFPGGRGLIQAQNGFLYGMNTSAGANADGAIIRYDINTNTFSIRYSFTVSIEGNYPYGNLVQASSGLFYGMTFQSSSGNGKLFSYNDDTQLTTIIRTFGGACSNGAHPYGTLYLASDGSLYGTSSLGGCSGDGNLFRITTSGTYTNLADLTDGKPKGTVVELGNGIFYGMAREEGLGKSGWFYRYNANTSTYTKLVDFSLRGFGASPTGSLVKTPDGSLYGMTPYGGSNDAGVIFKINPDSGIYSKLHDFPSSSRPEGSLILGSDGHLYGMTLLGGSLLGGTVFRYNLTTNIRLIMKNFSVSSGGRHPKGSLVQASNGLLYGMTAHGGTSDKGILFSINPANFAYSVLVNFDGTGSGDLPEGSLMQASNGKLYGMTRFGGANNDGVLFSFNPVGNTFSKILDFNDAATGKFAKGDLLEASNGKLYGMTPNGGANGTGVIFSVDPVTDSFLLEYSFPLSFGDSTGASPHGTLIQSVDGNLYGVTKSGGIYTDPSFKGGVAFKFDPLTSSFTRIKNFEYGEANRPDKSSFIEIGVSLETDTVASSVCAGSVIEIPFTLTGYPNTGNVVTAQLSDLSGNFASPVNIGSLATGTSDTIIAEIPISTPAGSGYKIRVVSSSPYSVGSESPTSVTVNAFIVPLFLETMGTVAATTAISSHESSNGFDNDSFTMTGNADVRNTQSSLGKYSGASGGANIYISNTTGREFMISGINTTGSNGMELSFGIHKSTNSSSDNPQVQYSTDGLSFFSLSYPSLPSGGGTADWHYRTTTGIIPSVSNLRIRFRQSNGSPANQYRIDDVKLIGTAFADSITPPGPFQFCNGESLVLTASPASSYLWSNGASTSSITVSATGNYSCVLMAENACTLNTNTVQLSAEQVSDQSLTGTGSFCGYPGNSVSLGLAGSELNVNYQLRLNSITDIGSPVVGTGSSITLANVSAAGYYSVIGTHQASLCTLRMTDSLLLSPITPDTFYLDADGDGFGDFSVDSLYCSTPAGYVNNNLDCDDSDFYAVPGQTWYLDQDGDGYGTGASLVQCLRPVNGYVLSEMIAASGDCNDTAASAYPGATEICNGIDDDCDLYVDEGCGPPIYCIGPSASYTPPSGPSYINQFSPFPTLTAAVTALNGFAATGHVIFEFQTDYTGSGETFPVTITYQGNAAATAVFRPRSDQTTSLIISGSATSVSRLLYFNGTDYVTMDGSPGGTMGTTSKLTIRNTSTSGTTGYNVHFINDATHNTLNAIRIEGGNNATACVYFGTTTGTDGNDDNKIQNCLIRDRSDATFIPPTNGIQSTGSGSGLTANSGTSITANQFENIRNGIIIGSNGNNGKLDIHDNHFFFTSSNPSYSLNKGIEIISSDTTSVNITGNYIGGSEAYAGGAQLVNTTAVDFIGMRVSNSTSSMQAIIEGNVISNMAMTSNGVRTFRGIWFPSSGPVYVANNLIGNPLIDGDLYFSDSTRVVFTGILAGGSQNTARAEINNNTIGGLSLMNSTGTAGSFMGLQYSNLGLNIDSAFITNNLIKNINYASKGVFTAISVAGTQNSPAYTAVRKNVIEDIVISSDTSAESVLLKLTSAPSDLTGNRIGSSFIASDIVNARSGAQYGIFIDPVHSAGTITVEDDTVQSIQMTSTASNSTFTALLLKSQFSLVQHVFNNCIREIQSASTMSGSSVNADVSSAITGIFINSLRSSLPSDSIAGNLISGLSVTTTGSSFPMINGIYSLNPRVSFDRNTINNLSNAAVVVSAPYPKLFGLHIDEMNNGTVSNNMISIDNAGMNNGVDIDCIRHTTGGVPDVLFYHNSLAVSGNSSNGGWTSAFYRGYSNPVTTVNQFRNNIFYNSRSGSGTHLGFHNGLVNATWNSMTSDFNLFFALDSTKVAYWGATPRTLSQWRTSSGGDINSFSSEVYFINIAEDLHLSSPGNCILDEMGTPLAQVPFDFDLQSRHLTNPDIGADEFSSGNSLPGAGMISGTDTVCAGQDTIVYAIAVIPGASSYSWTLPVGFNIISGAGTNSITVNAGMSAVSGNISVYGTNGICNSPVSTLFVTVSSCAIQLNLKAFIQGFYTGAGVMAAVADPFSYPLLCDSITIEIRSSSSPYSIVHIESGTIATDGNGSFTLPGVLTGGNYYLVIRHRNSLETWSANPVNLGAVTSYDFSTSASQAYGSNQMDMGGGVFAIYSGDISNGILAGQQDGLVDEEDYLEMQNAILGIYSGYVISDLTGDRLTEAADFSLIENNWSQSVSVIKP